MWMESFPYKSTGNLLIAVSYKFLCSSSIPKFIIEWSHFLIRRQENCF